MKRCSMCGEEKELTSFGKDRHTPDGHNHACFMCRRAATVRIRAAWTDEEWEAFHVRSRKNAKCRYAKLAREDKDVINQRKNEWRQRNLEKRRRVRREWRKNNPEKIEQLAAENITRKKTIRSLRQLERFGIH